jgi:hypothetical protein
MSYINRPVVATSKGINSQTYFEFSPTNIRKNYLVTSTNLLKKETEKTNNFNLLNLEMKPKKKEKKESNQYAKFVKNTEDNDDSFDQFKRGILLI